MQSLLGCEDGDATDPAGPALATVPTIPTIPLATRGETPPGPSVDVVWTGNAPASQVRIEVIDPDGRTGWRLGMAETTPSRRGWFGEDCFVGMGAAVVCHEVGDDGQLVLEAVRRSNQVIAGQTTLLQSHLPVTFVLEREDECWVFGADPSYYQARDCAMLDESNVQWRTRPGCAGLDPADPAPLGGWVALTFDDGPDLAVTPRILQTLRAHGVPATFFMVGERLSDPATWPLVEEVVADPLFDVGNHSFDHANQADLTDEEAVAQTTTTAQLLATFGVTPEFYRFPYGSSACRTADLVRAQGYRVAGWHVDSADWCYAWNGRAGRGRCTSTDYWRVDDAFADDMVGYVMHQVNRFQGGVILLHDIHPYTADQLPGLITHLRTEGFRFARLSNAERFPLLNRGEPFAYPRLGEACDPTADRCWETEEQATCRPTSSDEGFCTLACGKGCVERDGAAPVWCATVPGGGRCVAQAVPMNATCAAVPGTVPAVRASAHGPGSARVCVPPEWVD